MVCSCHMKLFCFFLFFKCEEKQSTQNCLGYVRSVHISWPPVEELPLQFYWIVIFEICMLTSSRRSLFPEQIPRDGLWLCNQTSLWHQHHDPHLPEHGHHDGGDWRPEQTHDAGFVPDQPCVHYPVHWRICAKAYLPQILLLHHRLEHLWLCGGYSLHCR